MRRSEYEAKLKKYEEEIKETKKRIEELQKIEIEEDDDSRPKLYEEYWFIDGYGEAHREFWNYLYGDTYRFDNGNVFKTEEEAKDEVERRKVLTELKKFSREFTYGDYNYYLSLVMNRKSYNGISYDIGTDRKNQGVIYFESEKKAREAVQKVGEDRVKKYIFGVE